MCADLVGADMDIVVALSWAVCLPTQHMLVGAHVRAYSIVVLL